MFQTAMANPGAKFNDKDDVFSNGSALAIIMITSGFLLMLTGVILSAISFITRGKFHGWDVIILIASFMFLAFGSHFLDKNDAAQEAAKAEHCKKYEMTDEECEELRISK